MKEFFERVLKWFGIRYEASYDPEYEKYSYEDFRRGVEDGIFTSQDGAGFFATEDYESSRYVFYNDGRFRERPVWCDYVNWYAA